jgi:hypothetical protein
MIAQYEKGALCAWVEMERSTVNIDCHDSQCAAGGRAREVVVAFLRAGTLATAAIY